MLNFFYRRFFMSRSQKMLGVLLACVIACAALFGWMLAQSNVDAQAETSTGATMSIEVPIDVSIDGTEYRGTANIVVAIGGTGHGYIRAEVQNILTFPDVTVKAYIELYSSLTYQESHENMQLEYRDYTSSLQSGESLGLMVSTNNEQKYWQARARYQVEGTAWRVINTSSILFDANGNEVV